MTDPVIAPPAAKRAVGIIATAANDVNAQLSIIVSCLDAMGRKHPEDPDVSEAYASAQRIIWQMASLSRYARRRGIRPVPAGVEALVLEADAKEADLRFVRGL
jgi:hypothetical protein